MPRFNGQSSIGGKSYIVVAASNSSTDFRTSANYLCDGTADQTEINAAITALGSSGGTVYLCPGSYYTSATIAITSQNGVFLQGGGRRAVRIRPQAQTFAAITITGTCVEWKLEDFTVDYADAATPATNGAAIGISLVTDSSNYPYQFSIRNITLQYCYCGFYDPTAAFMYDLINIYVATPYAYGFRKETIGGTTVTLMNCYVNGLQSGTGYRFVAVDQIKLLNCACDNLVTGGDCLFLESCRGSIDGFFAESNTLINNKAIVQISGSIINIQGYKAISNIYTPTIANEAYGIRATDSSIITCIAPMSLTQTNSGAGVSYEIISMDTPFILIGESTAAATNTGGGASHDVYTTNNKISYFDSNGGFNPASGLSYTTSTDVGLTITRSAFGPSQINLISALNGDVYAAGVNNVLQQVADDASITILTTPPNDRQAIIFAMNDTDTTSATFLLSGGVVAKLGGGTTWDNADTDGKECVFLSGGNLVLKNRLGSAKYFSVGITRYF